MRKLRRILPLLLVLVFIGAQWSLPVLAAEAEPYTAVIVDDAGLLTKSEEKELQSVMNEITPYGNALFITLDENPYGDAQEFSEELYMETYGNDSGVIFLIDLDTRKLYITSNGALHKEVTDAKARTITDNVFRMASDGDYFGCAKEAFTEIKTIAAGGKIAEPMKVVSNILIALVAAAVINFLIVRRAVSIRVPNRGELRKAVKLESAGDEAVSEKTGETKRYDPIRSSSGGSGGGRSGGGGGGFSGGGGGHSF